MLQCRLWLSKTVHKETKHIVEITFDSIENENSEVEIDVEIDVGIRIT